GHDADRAGRARQRALARLVEEPLGLKPRLQLFEREAQSAQPERLHVNGVELQPPASGPERHAAEDDDLGAVHRLEDEPRRLVPEHDGVELRGVVLQAEPELAAPGALHARELAGHPDVADAVLERALDAGRELRNGENARAASEPEAHGAPTYRAWRRRS